jgi:Leucine-rich repeat (LRR) protein
MKPQVDAVEISPQPAPNRRLHLLRFSVRGLTVLVAGLARWLAWIVHSTRAQHDAIAAMRNAGGFVEYDRVDWSALGPSGERIRRALDWLLSPRAEDYLDHPVGVFWGGSNCECKLSDRQQRGLAPALAQIGVLSRLENLDLSWIGAQDSELAGIKHLTRLKVLDLSYTSLTDPWLFHFEGLTRLRRLRLIDTGITDVGLVHLRGLTQLRELDLGGTRVTDAGLIHLERLENLTRLCLHDTKVSDAGIQRLKRALPACKVYYSGEL